MSSTAFDDQFNDPPSETSEAKARPYAAGTPENIRAGDPYDDPAFERLAREHDVWGRAESALCAVFWLAGKKQPSSGQRAAPADAIAEAIDILTQSADDLRECHTLSTAPDDWSGELEAKAEYDRILRCVAALRAQPAAAMPDEIEGPVRRGIKQSSKEV